jgi:SpoVK/Ycf46/Vps4 family AAA+-type ATPase
MRLVGCARFKLSHAARVKNMLIVDQELGVPFISVSAPSIVSGMSGESEKTLRETFEEAKVRLTLCCKCCAILIISNFVPCSE